MSHAVRHGFHIGSDPVDRGGDAVLRASGDAHAEFMTGAPAPIEISPADVLRAFDLFQPEPGTQSVEDDPSDNGFPPEPLPPAIVSFSDGQFARQVARALDSPPPAQLSLPLGGVAPTDREIASARALMIGWIAALGIAAFAFLAQGPSVTTRSTTSEPEVPPVVEAPPVVEPPQTTGRGDIRLEAPSPQPAPRPRKTVRKPAESTVSATASQQPRP